MRKSSEERRILIEETALKLFAERGYAEVSVRDIAQACGIGESALYRHMSSKEELAVRVFREAYLQFAQEMLASAGQGASLKEKLGAYLEVMLDGFDRDPILMRFLLIHQHETLAKAVSSQDVTPVTVVRDALSVAASNGEIGCDDLDLEAALVMGASLQVMTFIFFGRLSAPAVSHHARVLKGLEGLLGLRT